MDAILNVNKPSQCSSAHVVAKVKRRLPRGTRIGHAGTLDPFATGVLLLLIGKATRQCESLMNFPKQYLATVKLGATTATDDPTSPEQSWPDAQIPTEERIRKELPSFVGAIAQKPPTFSAMKIGGQRAYRLAREGRPVPLQERTVNVYSIELLQYAWPLLQLKIDCGRGTYIRAIARDLGHALGVGGYLTELARTKVGPYTLEKAVKLELLLTGEITEHLQAAAFGG